MPTSSPAKTIFISYRHQDAPGEALRLCEELRRVLGPENVFMDVAGSIPMGSDFRHTISDSITACSIFLAVIGLHWSASIDQKGQRRIEKADDLVRLEIASALMQGKQVIPVLVNGASMPDVTTLPAEVQPLAYRQAVELTNKRWASDVPAFVERLKRDMQLDTGPGPRPWPWPWPWPWLRPWVAIVVALLLVVSLAVRLWPTDHTKEVTNAVAVWANALKTNDPAVVARCYGSTVAPYFVYPSMSNDGVLQQYRTMYGPNAQGGKTHIDDASVSDLQVGQATGDTVTATFMKHVSKSETNVKILRPAEHTVETRRMHLTYAKQAGAWKIVGETQE